MGMSSSQARLLTLTARMHDIEWRSQKIEADKLRLANDSRHAYEDYLRVLDAKKIQYKTLTQDGVITFRDATCNILQNGIIPGYAGERASDTLFLQSIEGKVMVTETVANEFGLKAEAVDKTMDEYLEWLGFERTKEVMKDVEKEDPNSVKTYTVYPNTNETDPVNNVSHTAYQPQKNEEGGIDYDALSGYAKFNDGHSASTSGATPVSTGASLSASGKYTISSAEELKALMDNGNASNTAGSTFILTGNIDLSSYTWTGIQNFAGTFDGNGYVISGLTGSNGLFASTSAGATVKNVGLEGVNINSSSNEVGGLIGRAENTNVLNCYTTGNVKGGTSTGGVIGYENISTSGTYTIDTVYSWANVQGSSCVGGLIGQTHSRNADYNIKNAYAVGNVTGSGDQVGGFAGYMYNDQDTTGLPTDISNAYAGGTVKGSNKVGGFFGEYLYWGDGGDYCYLTGLSATGKVVTSGSLQGAMAGLITISLESGLGYASEDQKYVNFIDCSYTGESGAPGAYGAIYDKSGNDVTHLVSSTGTAGLTLINMAGSVPSINADGTGAYMSNILGVLTKAGVFDACDDSTEDVAGMKSKIATFLGKFANNDTDNTQLWYLNLAMVDYLEHGSESDKALAQALYDDIMGATKSHVIAGNYTSGPALSGKVNRGAGHEWTVDGSHSVADGSIDIPSVKTIADELWGMMKKEDKTITKTAVDVEAWMASKYGALTAADKVTLANINDRIANGGDLTALTSAILSGGARVDYNTKWADGYKGGNWKINVGPDKTVTYTPGTMTVQELDHKEWDTDDPAISNAMAMWVIAQRGIEIIKEPDASSYTYLKNILELGTAVLTTFDPAGAVALQGLPAADILAMDEDEYNKKMGIENTSVSIRTSVQEVQDEKDLRKAEADYEAKMRQIDRKDRQYDTQLAACESERNAIKEEIDTLKTVTKDNVDRTFKLFS